MNKKNNVIVTIGRQVGSGGRIVGKMLAERLEVPFYDKRILDRASSESGIKNEFFERSDETFSPFRQIIGSAMSDVAMFQEQSNAILKAADEGGAVFVGRCSDYILREHSHVVNVFLVAEMPDRVARAVEYFKVSEQDALKLIREREKARSKYYSFFTDKTWGAAESYHLCLNTSLIGIEACVDVILKYINSIK
jgi:cytidylate kinase